jgi:hypothetical protein
MTRVRPRLRTQRKLNSSTAGGYIILCLKELFTNFLPL